MKRNLILFIILCSVLHLQAQNVGIGTPTPDYTLDVDGQLGINDYIYHNDDLEADTYTGFSTENTWEITAGSKKIMQADGTNSELVINQNAENVEFKVHGDGIDHLLYTDPSTNRVGIGTGTPNYLIDINGDMRVHGDGIDHLLYIDTSNDRVGIGNSTPEHLLDIDGDMRVHGDGIDHLMYIDSGNNKIGIGEATPAYLLDVKGDFRVHGDGIDHLIYADSDNDKVGIGTSTPTQMLEVDGITRTKGLEFISPYTGALTTFTQISTGNEVVTGGNPTGGVLSFNLQFPTFYINTPKVVATVKGTDNGPEADATFVVSVRTANSSGVTLNIVRVDGGTTDSSWTQNLIISWMAWE